MSVEGSQSREPARQSRRIKAVTTKLLLLLAVGVVLSRFRSDSFPSSYWTSDVGPKDATAAPFRSPRIVKVDASTAEKRPIVVSSANNSTGAPATAPAEALPQAPPHRKTLPFQVDLSVYPNSGTFYPEGTRRIPSIVHYVWLSGKPGKPFPFLKYLSFVSTVQTLRPAKIMLWRDHEPAGWYWQRLLQVAKKYNVVVEQHTARDVKHIFGNPVDVPAHKADILRLEALKKHGGVYLDLDVYVLKDFAPFYTHSTVMAQEGYPDEPDRLEPGGLCNAVIMAEPYSPFITRWMDQYTYFIDKQWSEHSVHVPWRLAKQYPDTISVLGPRAIFYPLWTAPHMELVYETTNYDFDASGQYAYHAWSHSGDGGDDLNPTNIWTTDTESESEDGVYETSFTRLVRRWADHELITDYMAARAKGLVD